MDPPPHPVTHGSVALTRGFRVAVAPRHLPDESDPDASRHVFAYRVTISNESPRPARLVSRRWRIRDAVGVERVVEGEGVVGAQPLISPGQAFQYTSFCPLNTPWGTMEGTYLMHADDGSTFEIEVGRFYLIAPDA